MTDFRSYYAFARINYDENGEAHIEIEKCYVDNPSSWSALAKAKIDKFLSDGVEIGSTGV